MEEYQFRAFMRQLKRIEDLLQQIVGKQQKRAVSATLVFQNSEGKNMDLSAHVNDVPGIAIFQEFDGPGGTGNPVPAIGPVSFTSDTPAVATVDPVTGQLTYLSAGTAKITGTDAGNGLTASPMLTLNASVQPAQSATLPLQPGVPSASAQKPMDLRRRQ